MPLYLPLWFNQAIAKCWNTPDSGESSILQHSAALVSHSMGVGKCVYEAGGLPNPRLSAS